LRQVRTLSVGEVAVGNLRISYYGTQRTVAYNEGRPVYGGSELVCVLGGWKVLDALPVARGTERRGGTRPDPSEETAQCVGSSLPGASVARAAPNSRQWQRSRGIRR
jgi:hypothetical protein